MLKVFFPEKIIYLINNREKFVKKKGTTLLVINSFTDMQQQYREVIKRPDIKEIYFFNENENHLFAYFSKLFHIVEAAGGLVQNAKSQWLFIFRLNKWDLPKGKLEKNETIPEAAMREVEEECGIGELSIITQLPSTYHVYFIDNKAVLKRTHWFEMDCKDQSPLVPQLDEGITDVKWFSTNDLKKVLDNTYESVRDVMLFIK